MWWNLGSGGSRRRRLGGCLGDWWWWTFCFVFGEVRFDGGCGGGGLIETDLVDGGVYRGVACG